MNGRSVSAGESSWKRDLGFESGDQQILNNIRMDARDSARLMVAYAPHLYRDGKVLMTLKLPENGRSQAIDHAFNILQTNYQILNARHLFHNRSEITLYLAKSS